MNDTIKWQSLFNHGIEEDGKRIFILLQDIKNDVVFSVYRKYYGEIKKRVAPTLKSIAKKRKKKEQQDLANAAKLTEIQEVNITEKENDRKIDTTSIPAPSSNRLSSPLPDVVNKQVQKAQSIPIKGMKMLICFVNESFYNRDNSIKRRFN
jgi:hypothetical protein